MSPDPRGFNAVAHAICDAIARDISSGEPPDWKAAETSASDDRELKIVQNLRAVAKVAEASQRIAATAAKSTVRSTRFASRRVADAPESWGHLKILGRIGKGAFGSVYRAWDSQLEMQVALKILRKPIGNDDSLSSAALKEGRLLARVNHENVARVHGVSTNAGQLGFWMELVEGPTLEDLVRERGTLPEAEAIDLGCQLCSALQAIHDAGVVHRDVKAQNVILDTRGGKRRVVLTDFGGGELRNLASRPHTEPPIGTPLYMAPQLFVGGVPSPRTDVYSVGVLLFYLTTGGYPVDAANVAALRLAHARGDRRRLRELAPELSDHFVRVVERACAADPAQRFESARKLELELSDRPIPEPPRVPSKRWKRAVPAGAIAAAVLGYILLRIPNASFTAQANLVRAQPGGQWEPLTNHSWTKIGDRIALEFEASIPAHVYVLNFDDMGRTYVLFPLPKCDLENPLPANSLVRLPGPEMGDETAWIVDSVGGRERFHVLVSRKELDWVQDIIDRLPAADSGPEVPSAEVRELLRGVGRVAKIDDPKLSGDSSAEELFEAIQRNSGPGKKTKDLWATEIVLQNPAQSE